MELTQTLHPEKTPALKRDVGSNQIWHISKIRATAPWLFYCSSFTIFGFLATCWIAEVRGKAGWFTLIKPAGTNTLLGYLIPTSSMRLSM